MQKSIGILFNDENKRAKKEKTPEQSTVLRKKHVLNTSKIARYVWIGRKDIDWYLDCENLFIEIFGPEELHLVTKLFAATSINTLLLSNINLFRRAYYEIKNELPIGNYLPSIKGQIERIRNGQDLSGRKISSFAKAMSGYKDAVVVDLWLTRAFGLDKEYVQASKNRMRTSSPSDSDYTLIENHVRHEARAMGLEPRQLSSMIWSGIRIATTGKKETHYKETLKKNLTNLFGVI